MMYLVTGGAGFIGSNLVGELNKRGTTDILVVDDLYQGDKFHNLDEVVICDYLDKKELRSLLEEDKEICSLRGIFHLGACTDTMENDGRYMMENNYTYSKKLLEWGIKRDIPVIYASSASVYGKNPDTKEIAANERPLNVYAYSKRIFDEYVRKRDIWKSKKVIGVRFFNVYGPHEAYKGKMSSMVYQLYRQIKSEGAGYLFEGVDGCPDGEQKRDFIHVADIVSLLIYFMENSVESGIYNGGTGNARSFNDIANSIITELGYGKIKYKPFPETLRNKYQMFTQADLSQVRKVGYNKDFLSIEEGIHLSIKEWERRQE